MLLNWLCGSELISQTPYPNCNEPPPLATNIRYLAQYNLNMEFQVQRARVLGEYRRDKVPRQVGYECASWALQDICFPSFLDGGFAC